MSPSLFLGEVTESFAFGLVALVVVPSAIFELVVVESEDVS
jgi:hypothetical protein